MKNFLAVYLLASYCSGVLAQRDSPHIHQRSDTDLRGVPCHHNAYGTGGPPEFVQESRVEPSREYLPQPKEEVPAASFDKPNVVAVENTFVSPPLQNSYKSLFDEKPDNVVPSAAQNVPSNALPEASRISNNKKHSHHDDENNLERLCSDAFHSFLCKPIKGVRKTPTGRLRANAVIPLDVLAGFSSNQNAARVQPDIPQSPSSTNIVGRAYLPPSQQATNPIPQISSFNKPSSTTTPRTPQYLPPAPFVNVLKEDNELSSPSNTDPQVLKPQPMIPTSNFSPLQPHDCEKHKFFSFPLQSHLTNENPSFVKPHTATTTKYFPNSFQNKPSSPFPFNSYLKTAKPLQTISPPHDCEQSKTTPSPFIANPSNNNLFFTKLFSPSTPKPFNNFYSQPSTQASAFSKSSLFSQTTTPQHDCSKLNEQSNPLANPSNESPTLVNPFGLPTQKPFPYTFTTKPSSSYFNNYTPISTFPSTPNNGHDCDKHKPFFVSDSINENKYFAKPYSQPSPKPVIYSTESPKVPLPSNNVAQIVAQPQQINSIAVSPKPSGYFYNKPAAPFPQPVGNPTNQKPSVAQIPTSTSGYRYNEPKLPFPSNNVQQILPQPTQKPVQAQPPLTATTEKPKTPCEHDKHQLGSLGNPTNEDVVLIKPNDGYSYERPNLPFPPENGGSSNENTVSLRPPVTTTPIPATGYYYNKPANPFLLPNPTNNFQNIAPNPANNGYNYQKPGNSLTAHKNDQTNNNQVIVTTQPSSTSRPFSSSGYQQSSASFPTSINSKLEETESQPNFIGNAQTLVEATVKPGYSYDRPKNSLLTSQESNQNANVGYSYPKPELQFDYKSLR